MDRLIGRAVPDAPALDGPGAQQRLALTIADLFRQQSQPVVLLLDDLHWAGESLLPLRELTRLAPQLPLLVVGTYRDDERPDLPADLPGARALTLERLSEDQIRTLSVSALGEAGATPRIVEFLKSETEGNAFFMVETLRALAEEAGQLSAIPQMDLPERMFPKGAQAVAQRRLDRLPIDYHPLLRVAAVAGRQIDLDLLRQIDPFVNLDRWLLACAEAGMITRDEGLWRFAHEKLRDGILFGLAEDQQPKLNRMVAEAMEAIHAEPEVYARALCDHWRRAGDPLKTVYYARHAAHQLMGISEYQGAVKLAERALDGLPDADMSDDALALRVLRAELLYTVGQYAEARQELEDTLPIARHGRHTHCVLTGVRIMGHVMQALGEYAEARRWMTESLDLARAVGNRPGEAQALRNLGLIAENLGELDLATDLYRHSLDLFRAVEDRMGTAGALANLGSVAVYRGQHDDAQARFDDALAIFQAIGYRWGIAYTLIRLGDVALRTGAYDEARAALEQALALCDEIGHRWGMAFAQIQLGHVSLAQRQYRQAGGCFYRALRAAWDIQAVPTALDALVGVAQFLQIDEDFERAVELLALALAHPSTDMETKTRATQALDALAGELAPDTLDSATAQGRVRDLAGVVGGLLDESAAMGWGA
jgi:tetratricopeptide (TPR) repeat protein